MVATADDVSGGRFGINVVAGANLTRVRADGRAAADWGDVRYDYASEWIDAVKRLWGDGAVGHDRRATGSSSTAASRSRSRSSSRTPPIVCAGSSPRGMQLRTRARHPRLHRRQRPRRPRRDQRPVPRRQPPSSGARSRPTPRSSTSSRTPTTQAAAKVQRYRDDPTSTRSPISSASTRATGAGESLRRTIVEAGEHVFFGGIVAGSPETVAEHVAGDRRRPASTGVLVIFTDWSGGIARFCDEVLPSRPGLAAPPSVDWAFGSGRPRMRSPMMRALDLRGPAGDRRGLRPQPLPGPLPASGGAVAHDRERGRPRGAGSCRSRRAWSGSTPGPGSMPASEARERPPVVQAQDRAARRTTARARRRPRRRRARPRCRGERVELVEEHLVHDLLLERERRAPLVGQRRARDRPALVQPTDEVILGHEDTVEEDLVELGLTRDLHQRPDLDPRRLHVDDHVARCRGASTRPDRCGRERSPTGRTARSSSRPSGPRAASRRRPAPPSSAATRGPSPASGSLNSWHQISLASRMRGSHRCFCSSVPCASSVGPARLMPTRFTGCSARDRAYSML